MARKFNKDEIAEDVLIEEKRQKVRRAACSIFLVLGAAALIGTIVFFVWRAFTGGGISEQSFKLSKATSAVGHIRTGAIRPNSHGVARLPDEFAGLAVDDKVYETVDEYGTFYFLFPTFRGKGMHLRGFVYHSNETPDPAPGFVKIDAPAINDPEAPPGPETQRIEFIVDKVEGSNWYHVHYDLD